MSMEQNWRRVELVDSPGGSHRRNYAREGPSDVFTVQQIIMGEKKGKGAGMDM